VENIVITGLHEGVENKSVVHACPSMAKQTICLNKTEAFQQI